MQKRKLGSTDIYIPPIGLGCMGLSEFYGPPTDKTLAIKLLHEAIDLGIKHFDTAEIYGFRSANETLLGDAFTGKRDGLFFATKFGPTRDWETGMRIGIDGSRRNCRRAVEGSLRRLKTDFIDLYYLHRVDPATPIEETVSAMAELVAEGKVRAIGLSEAAGDTIRRAAKVHPISAVQSEYSIFARDIETDVIPACLEVGASLIAYSPLGRGMLSGRFKNESLGADDWRKGNPRFQGNAYMTNLVLADEIEAIAQNKACAAAQVALAWVMAQGDHVLTIPGTTRLENLETNVGSYDILLAPSELDALNRLAERVEGERYDELGMRTIYG